MSSQTTLGDIPSWKRLESGAAYRPTHTPASTPDQQIKNAQACQQCGTHLTEMVRRVVGDNQNVVWECPHCPGTNRDGFVASANPAGTARDTRDVRDGARMEGP